MADGEDWAHKRWAHEQKQRLAERAHDANSENAAQTNAATVESGHHALRTIMLINGGAAIALLAFIGAIASKEGVSSVADLAAAIQWFALGVAVTAAAMGFAYFVNYCYVASLYSVELDWEHPYVKDTPKSKRWERIGLTLHVITPVLAAVALVMFVCGMWNVQQEVVKLRVKAPTAMSAPMEKK